METPIASPASAIIATPKSSQGSNATPIKREAQTPDNTTPPSYDPFGYREPYNEVPTTPSMLEPDRLEDLFDEVVSK